MSRTTLRRISLLFGIFTIAHGAELQQFEAFIEDLISTWQLKSPTIVFYGDLPQICMNRQWLLCVSHDQNTNELPHHLASIHLRRKQDGLIFVGNKSLENLLKHLTEVSPSIMTSNYPVFMPISYQNDIQLRLDSNIIYYMDSGNGNYELYDIFAVKGGPSITMDIGKWNYNSGMKLSRSLNMWDRRTHLQGNTIINCFAFNPDWAEFIKDKNGIIIGSKGYVQDILFYATDHLNLTIETIEAPWVNKMLKNGSWTGQIGFLQRKEADVVTTKLGISLHRSNFIDYPIETNYKKLGLSAVIPIKGISPNMWVYVNVFGFSQWMIFVILLIFILMGLTLVHTLSDDKSGREFGTKRGSNKNYRLDSASSALAMVFLFTVQMGSHTNSKQLAPRLLTLTMSILTLLLFAFFTTDITAEMTSGPPEIPIRTYEDVIYHNYKVLSTSSYYERLLTNSKPGSAKREVHEHHFERKRDQDDLDEVVSEMIGNPKTLYLGLSRPLKRRISTETHKAFELKMDDSFYTHGGLGLQKDSEFLSMFNHYILKGMENGMLPKFLRAIRLEPQENFEMKEPQPLGLNNVMFCFICLGIGICVSIINVMIELLIRKTSKKQGVVKNYGRKDTTLSIWATRSTNIEVNKKEL